MAQAVRRHPRGQHLDLARCIEGIGKHDLAMATRTMAGALHILQRDLLISCVREELVQNEKAGAHFCTDICTTGLVLFT